MVLAQIFGVARYTISTDHTDTNFVSWVGAEVPNSRCPASEFITFRKGKTDDVRALEPAMFSINGLSKAADIAA
jgi:hypothetical protein